MPTFDDTWMFPTPNILSIATGADRDHPASNPRICGLCGTAYPVYGNLTNTHMQSPCDNISCAACTWLWRNGDSTCHGCSARFTCPSRRQASPSSEPVSISSHRTKAPDDGYDGDDEREAFSVLGCTSLSGPERLARRKGRKVRIRARIRAIGERVFGKSSANPLGGNSGIVLSKARGKRQQQRRRLEMIG